MSNRKMVKLAYISFSDIDLYHPRPVSFLIGDVLHG